MTEFEHLRQQLGDLQSHLGHLELTIQNLSDNAAKQWDTIEILEQTVKGLKQRCLALEEGGDSAAAPEEPPPHY
jgi:SlyX protein